MSVSASTLRPEAPARGVAGGADVRDSVSAAEDALQYTEFRRAT